MGDKNCYSMAAGSGVETPDFRPLANRAPHEFTLQGELLRLFVSVQKVVARNVGLRQNGA